MRHDRKRDPGSCRGGTEWLFPGIPVAQQRSLSGSLTDKIGELLARRFSRHEEEHRDDQEEREGEERQRRCDRMRRCHPTDDRRRESSACAAGREGGAPASLSTFWQRRRPYPAHPSVSERMVPVAYLSRDDPRLDRCPTKSPYTAKRSPLSRAFVLRRLSDAAPSTGSIARVGPASETLPDNARSDREPARPHGPFPWTAVRRRAGRPHL